MFGQQARQSGTIDQIRGVLSRCGHQGCQECDVRGVAVCSAVGPDMLPRLAAIATERSLETEQVLFDEGDVAGSAYVVTAGMLKLYKVLADGRRQVVGFMVPGDFLGLAFGRLYLYSAEAVTPVTLCCFRRPQFLDLLDACPALEKEILLRTSTELAAAQEQMLLLGRKSATERLASFILSMARRRRVRTNDPVELPMSRVDIADYLGLTVETVSRTFSLLRKKALIELREKHQVSITRPAQLEHLSGA